MTNRTAFVLMWVFLILALVMFGVAAWLRWHIAAGGVDPIGATATFGAQQFYIQLTAIAGGK